MINFKVLWKEVITPMFFKRPKVVPDELKEFNAKYPDGFRNWTIYGDDILISKYTKEFSRIHSSWKYGLAVPLFKLSEMIIPKRQLERKPANHWHDLQLKAIDEAFEESVDDWISYFLKWRYFKDDFSALSAKEFDKKVQLLKERGIASAIMRSYKIARTVALNDTAYRELANIFAFNLYFKMDKIYHNREINHLLYVSRYIDDVNYYVIGASLSNGTISLNKLRKNVEGEKYGNVPDIQK